VNPQPKEGHFFSDVFLEFVRNLPCSFCQAPPRSDPHHFPPKGRGVTRDDFACPACRECHDRCDGRTVNGKPPIPEEVQSIAVLVTRSEFLRASSDAQFDAYKMARRKWRQRRMGL
jgi:hypothetical protein